MVSVSENASKIREILLAQGSLNLWEVRAILNESRESAFQVLLWMASRKEIAYCLKDQELYVTLTAASRERRATWQSQLKEPLAGSAMSSQ